MTKSLVFVLALFACGGGRPAADENQLAVRTTPAVVKVWAGWETELEIPLLGLRTSLGPGSGSGFFISADGWLVTNAHVIEDAERPAEEVRREVLRDVIEQILARREVREATADQQRAIVQSIRITKFQRVRTIQLTDGRHVGYTVMKAGDTDIRSGKDLAILKVAIENAPTLRLGDSSKVRLEDRLYAIGFPGAANFRRLEGNGPRYGDTDPIVASFTDGKVSSVDQRASSGVPVLQVTIPITHGNSGGPVVDQRGEVVGLATWGAVENGASVAGFNFLVTINAVKDYIRASGATTDPSDTDRLFRSGLAHYANGDHAAAIRTFEEVKGLFPSHPELAKLLASARRNVREGNTGGETSHAAIGITITLALVVLAGALVVRRKRVAPVARTVAMPGAMAGTMLAQITCGTLHCVRGPLAGRRFDIPAAGLVIGRDPAASIIVDHARISGRHARIMVSAGRIAIRDDGSTNGTFHNHARVPRGTPVALAPGDHVVLADPDLATFVFQPLAQVSPRTLRGVA